MHYERKTKARRPYRPTNKGRKAIQPVAGADANPHPFQTLGPAIVVQSRMEQ